MYRNNRFGKLWASRSSTVEWPSDANAETGWGYLGTDTPTTGQHDAALQANDWKDNWLHDQMVAVFNNFGAITPNYDDAGSRNALSDAIYWALLNQNQSSVDRLGIIRTATEAQAIEGTDNHLAIVPLTLERTITNRLVWDGVKNKPETATRWPTWAEVTNKPPFGSAAWLNSDTWDYAGTALNYYNSVSNDLKVMSGKLSGIAWDGAINSATGVLDKAHGGRGRGDNSYDGEWFYANGGGVTNTGFVLGSSLSTKITTGDDNGDNLDVSSNMNLDTWWGVGIRSSINSYQTTWKHDARSGVTRQRGGMYLNDFVRSTTTTARLLNSYGDAIEVQGGNKLILRNSQGYERFHVYDGAVWSAGDLVCGGNGRISGTLEVRGTGIEVYGDTPFIDLHYGNSSDDYSIRLIAETASRLGISSSVAVRQDLSVDGKLTGGGLGTSAYANIFDRASLSITDIPYGTQVASSGVLRICMNSLSAVWNKGVSTANFNDLAGDSNELLTSRQFVDFKNASNTVGGIGSYTILKIRGTSGNSGSSLHTSVRPGWVMSDLGNYADGMRAAWGSISGTWIVMAVFSDVGYFGDGQDRDIMFVKRLR